MNNKKQTKPKQLLFITIGIFIISFVLTSEIKALESDLSGSTSATGGDCSGKNSCWTYISSGINEATYGIRATVVDGNGSPVSKSIDFLAFDEWTKFINSKTTYNRCINDNETKNRVSYLNGSQSCTWKLHNGNTIAETLTWLPDIYGENNATGTIKDYITNNDNYRNDFLKKINYTIPTDNSTLENHYLIIEPLTYVRIGDQYYYGTYYELKNKIQTGHNIWYVGAQYMSLSMYITGNSEIKGTGGYKEDEGYFNGILKIADFTSSCYRDRSDGRTGKAVQSTCIKNSNLGYGIGLFWMKDIIPQQKRETCNYNNSKHFETENGGPNEENCCTYVKNNLSSYGITEAQLYTKYPQCHAELNSCEFKPTTKYPSCNVSSTGEILDIKNWNCIYASAYSNDTSIKNYFLKYGKPTDSCSVYCRNEIIYTYPSSSMITLAGNYFTISNKTNTYSTYLDTATNTTKVRAATLGPVQISVTKQCAILGDKNNSRCKNALNNELNNIKAPDVEFAYSSKYYNNPKETLSSTGTSKNSIDGDIHTRTVTYEYSLPNTTYKYVSKNTGVSYKNLSDLGNKPYIEIGNHLPIHFSEQIGTLNYQLTIQNFNLTNFDNLILNGQKMSTNFVTSIETYIKTLIDAGMARPVYINGKYYFDQNFINLLKQNNFSINKLLTSTCGDTNNYTCYNDNNGVYCYDEGKTTNSEQTYAYFNSCINSEVQKIKSEKVSYKNDMLYQCTFKVKTTSDPDDDPVPDDDPSSGIDVIFRPISLNDPFPSIDGDGRITGSNWCYGEDCSNTNLVVQNVITNNRGVETEQIYKERDPLYTITLTPGLIKEIRRYNKKTNYDDFKLECNSDGNKCKSDFIRKTLNQGQYNFSSHFNGCGIKNKSHGLNCQDIDKW